MNPNELRRKAAEVLAKAKAIQDELSAADCDLTAEQREARSAKVEDLLTEVESLKAKASEVEAAEKQDRERAERINRLSAEANALTGRKTDPDNAVAPRVEVKEPEWTNDPMKGFKTPREFFSAVIAPKADDGRLRYLAAAGTDEHQAGSDPYGGFLVPEGMSPGLERLMPEDDPFAGQTRTIPMQTTVVKVNARVDKDHTSSVSGGLTVSRSSETAAKSSSRMSMEQVKLEANSLFGFAYATEELLRDSPASVASILEQGFRDEFTSNHVKELLRGTGVGEPEGIQNNPALITVAKENSQTADTIVGENIIKMRARCWRYSRAFWLANHDTYPQLATAHITGTNGDVFLYQPGRGIDVPDTLLGRPVIFTEYAEKLGDKNDIMLVVPSEITEGTYQPLESAESIHVRFDRHERAFKFWLRNDARSLWRAALTPNKSADTLSPFVTLAARA